jgi:polyhydroxybutyrate depolymerase
LEEHVKKWLTSLTLLVMGLPITLALLGMLAFLVANRTNGSLVSSGKRRKYLLHVPRNYDPTKPAPLVISIHGYAEWPAHQMQISRWNELADREGFLVVYPCGTGFPLHWRTHEAPGSDSDPILDVRFISDLIDKLERTYNIDPARIYANGLSNGGGMSFVLSADLSERIAAIGMVSGAYFYSWEAYHPSRPVPAVIFHGTADQVVPFQGGPSRVFDLPFPCVPQWVETLAQRNGCPGVVESLPPSGEVSGVRYTDCAAEVDFYTIAGGGHAWPGGKALPRIISGYATQNVDATRIMWDFFKRHPLY